MTKTKHTPTIELDAARMTLDLAMIECVHWDFESEGDAPHEECCYRLDEAKRRYRAAKAAVTRAGL